METRQPLIVSLGLFQDSGGPVKTIRKFKEAMNAKAFSFADPLRMDREEIAVDGAIGIASSRIPMLREFNYIHAREKAEFLKSAEVASVISCHSFYRYHVKVVEQLYHDKGVPYWFVPHGILDPWVYQKNRLAKSAFRRWIGDRFLNNCKTVIFSTRAERDKAASYIKLPSSTVVPWPVEKVEIDDPIKRRERIRAQYGIPSDARVLLYFGRLHSMKCPLETIRAVGSIKYPKLYLIMLGNENDVTRAQCLDTAAKCGLKDRLIFVGPVYGNAKYDVINASDAYISLSFRENFNHTAAECLACAKPVILSPGNDLLSEIADVGCTIPMASIAESDVRRSIEQFIELSGEELEKSGKLGQEWVSGNLGFDQFQNALMKLVSEHGLT